MTDEQINAIFDAHSWWWNGSHRMLDETAIARAIIEAAAPEIRRVERERCAKLIDKREMRAMSIARVVELQDAAAAIRSLPDAG